MANTAESGGRARAGEEEMKGALNAMRSIQRKTEELQLAVQKLGAVRRRLARCQAINALPSRPTCLPLMRP